MSLALLLFIRREIFRVELFPILCVLLELCSTGGKERQILQAFVMGKIGEQLLFKLWPVPAGDARHLYNFQKSTEQCGHLGIMRRSAFGKGAIQIKND